MPKPPASAVYGRAQREPLPLRPKEYPRERRLSAGVDKDPQTWQYPSTVGIRVIRHGKPPKPVDDDHAQFRRVSPLVTRKPCLRYLVATLPEGVHCPRCGIIQTVYELPLATSVSLAVRASARRTATDFRRWPGRSLRTPRSPSETGIESPIFMLTSKKGMSAFQIQRVYGLRFSYETAHSMCHKIRAALIDPALKAGRHRRNRRNHVGGKDRHTFHFRYSFKCCCKVLLGLSFPRVAGFYPSNHGPRAGSGRLRAYPRYPPINAFAAPRWKAAGDVRLLVLQPTCFLSRILGTSRRPLLGADDWNTTRI